MSARKSDAPTFPYTYRLTADDRTVLETEHGTLANFFNERVKAEVKRIERVAMLAQNRLNKIEKKSKGAKTKVKPKL
jgi:uncharacterized protein YacL (UPF0231 family)